LKASRDELKVFLRAPQLPAIIISKEQLYVASDVPSLAAAVLKAEPHRAMTLHVYVVDSTGAEFWFVPEQRILAPGFLTHKWKKREIINLFNASTNASRLGIQYSPKSLSNKTLAQVIADVISLITNSTESQQARGK
jgi:hypothetical protein